MQMIKRSISYLLSLVIAFMVLVTPSTAQAYSLTDLMIDSAWDWLAGISGNNKGTWNVVDPLAGVLLGVDRPAASSQPQKYYTTPTSSVQDKYGNVTNYYRGGDTTNTKIIDSYNKTFNTIHNTSNTTNNYQANITTRNIAQK